MSKGKIHDRTRLFVSASVSGVIAACGVVAAGFAIVPWAHVVALPVGLLRIILFVLLSRSTAPVGSPTAGCGLVLCAGATVVGAILTIDVLT